MAMTRFSLNLASISVALSERRGTFEGMCDVAKAAEDAGFDTIFVPDHTCAGLIPVRLEPYTLLGAIAARTDRVQLGAGVSAVMFRNPAHLAKIVTTLDV